MTSAKVTWGLLAAWVLHDVEELATMSRWTKKHRFVPDTSPTQAAVAVGAVGMVVAAAALRGARTGGRSGFFQSALIGFGLHSVTHVAASAALHEYTPGVLTAPTLVAPFSIWAVRQLKKEGVPITGGSKSAALWFPAVVVGAHLCARTPLVSAAVRKVHSLIG